MNKNDYEHKEEINVINWTAYGLANSIYKANPQKSWKEPKNLPKQKIIASGFLFFPIDNSQLAHVSVANSRILSISAVVSSSWRHERKMEIEIVFNFWKVVKTKTKIFWEIIFSDMFLCLDRFGKERFLESSLAFTLLKFLKFMKNIRYLWNIETPIARFWVHYLWPWTSSWYEAT